MIYQEFLIAKLEKKNCGRFIKGGKYPIIILGSVGNFENSISNGANLRYICIIKKNNKIIRGIL